MLKFLPILIALTVILLLVFIISYPFPIIRLALRSYSLENDYDLSPAAKKYKNYILYGGGDGKKNKNLIIWFHGGCFVWCHIVSAFGFLNTLYENLNPKNEDKETAGYDILLFYYPPISYTVGVKDIMMYINKLFQEINIKNKYTTVHGCGMSAGALLLGAFQLKEENPDISQKMNIPAIGVQFKSLISLSGLLDPNFKNSIISFIFKSYFCKNLDGCHYYSWYNLKENTPKLIISPQEDFLFRQSLDFATKNNCKFKFYDNKNLTHRSLMALNHRETQECIKSVSSFISEIDNENSKPNLLSKKELLYKNFSNLSALV